MGASWQDRYGEWFAAPQTLVVQPTSWCNLDCTYCYLPFRRVKNEMRPEVAAAVAASAEDLGDDAYPLGVVWHGGEPLAVGHRKFADLLAPFEGLRRSGRVQHYVQTNATLINDAWCDLLNAHQVRVGVSIDGPAAFNTQRVDLRRRPAFARIARGIKRLREHGIGFSVIAVVAAESISHPEELLDFLADLGAHTIGLNIEETEGANMHRRPPTPEQAEEFWRRTLAWSRSRTAAPALRELERLAEYLHLIRNGHRPEWESRRLDPIPTVSAAGDVVLLSPELADTTDATYGDFLAGNVLDQSLTDILHDASQHRYVREFIVGLERCRAECTFFDFCRGAQAANRYFENGSFASTETNYCRVSRQALVAAVAATVTKEEPV